MTIDLIDLREDIAGVLDDHNPNPTAAWWARTAQELLDQLDQAEAELDSWMARAYEAEGKLWKAEARIKAVQHLIDQADEMGEWAITCTRLQWAIDGSAPQPGT